MNEFDLSARGPSPASKTGWGPSATARTDLGSYRLRNCTVREFPFWQIPSGICKLWGRYLTFQRRLYGIDSFFFLTLL